MDVDIGIGLPSTIPGTGARQVIEWARTAEECGFSTLGVIDRLAYGNIEPLITLGTAAAVTERIKLMTAILLVPFRANAALVAKQAASVNHLSAGRLTLGMAVGGFAEDYEVSGVPYGERGKRFDAMLEDMTRIWAGDTSIGPVPGIRRDQIVFGGHSSKAVSRVATWGGGWIGGSGGVDAFREGAEAVRQAWRERGREGAPRLMALPYFSLGDRARDNAEAFLSDFYGVEEELAARRIAGALTDVTRVREALAAYEEAGCDELMLFPCSPGPEQVHLLADAIR